MSCRRCPECRGLPHHWYDFLTNDEDIPCKHCEARGEACASCDGSGDGSIGARDPWRPCDVCGGGGIVVMPGAEHLQ
jgi:hypothetical protein